MPVHPLRLRLIQKTLKISGNKSWTTKVKHCQCDCDYMLSSYLIIFEAKVQQSVPVIPYLGRTE